MSDPYGMAEAMGQLEADIGATITWNGTVYPCQIGARRESKDLGDGGFALDAQLEIVVRQELFTAGFPTAKQTVTLDSRVLRIVDVLHAPDASCLVLSCEDNTRGV